MMRLLRPALFLFGLSALLQISFARANADMPVADLGDLGRVELRGAQVIPANDLRQALLSDSEFQLASTPTAPLRDFLQITKTKLELGYLRAGFPDAKVDLTVDAARQVLVIQVNEGPRLIAREIEIVGAKQIDANRLRALLLKGSEPGRFPLHLVDGGAEVASLGDPDKAKTPLWESGAPAPLDRLAIDRFTADVNQGLALQGFFAPRFSIKTKRGGETANLIITIEDEGPRAAVGEIEIIGAKRNKTQDVLDYLKIAPGMPLDTSQLQAMQVKLWNSARFWRHTLTMTRVNGDPAHVKLKIDLVEHEHAPTLNQPLSVEEVALLRCKDWFEASILAGSDVAIEAKDVRMKGRIVLKPSEGIVWHFAPLTSKPASATTSRTDIPAWLADINAGFAMTSDRLGFYDLANHEGVVWDAAALRMGTVVMIRFVPDSTKAGPTFLIGGSISHTTKETGKNDNLDFDVQLAPVCVVDLFRRNTSEKVDAQIKDGVFALSFGDITFRCDKDTGKLIDIVGKSAGMTYRISIEPGAFQREIALLEKAAPRQQSAAAAPTRPSDVIIAAVAYAFNYAVPTDSPQNRLPASRALRKLLSPAGVAICDLLHSDDYHFDIPADPAAAIKTSGNLLSILIEGVPWLDRISTRGSWPWTLSRESLLLLAGRAKYTHLEAGRLMQSPDMGPIGCLAVSRAYVAVNDPVTARIFAKRGLERLTVEFFHKDCDALFAGHTPQAKVFAAFAHSLRDMSDEELDSLDNLTGKRQINVLKFIAKSERTIPKDSPDLFPLALQKSAWETGVKDILETELTNLAQSK